MAKVPVRLADMLAPAKETVQPEAGQTAGERAKSSGTRAKAARTTAEPAPKTRAPRTTVEPAPKTRAPRTTVEPEGKAEADRTTATKRATSAKPPRRAVQAAIAAESTGTSAPIWTAGMTPPERPDPEYRRPRRRLLDSETEPKKRGRPSKKPLPKWQQLAKPKAYLAWPGRGRGAGSPGCHPGQAAPTGHRRENHGKHIDTYSVRVAAGGGCTVSGRAHRGRAGCQFGSVQIPGRGCWLRFPLP